MRIYTTTIPTRLWIVLAILAPLVAASQPATKPTGFNTYASEEERLLSELGLTDDAPDEEIVSLLDDSRKRFHAMSLVARRKISSATPKLLEMLDKKGETVIEKLSMAETLFALGNNDWIEPMRKRGLNPNAPMGDGTRLGIACLLARTGDHSVFKMMLDPTNMTSTVSEAVRKIAKCCENGCADPNIAVEVLLPIAKSAPEALVQRSAVESLAMVARHNEIAPRLVEAVVSFLCSVVTNDQDTSVRRCALSSLDKIALARREIAPQLMAVLEANLKSNDGDVNKACVSLLRIWRPRLLTNQEVLALLGTEGLSPAVLGQIRDRKLRAAVPKLQAIVRGNGSFYSRLTAAKTLGGLGDTSWTTEMKPFAVDPNAGAKLSDRIAIAGMLAWAGDYSQFEIAAGNAACENSSIKLAVSVALRNFGDADDKIAVRAAESMVTLAISASEQMQRRAFSYLNEMAEAKPELLPAIVKTLEAYPDNDAAWWTTRIYRNKLNEWRQGRKAD